MNIFFLSCFSVNEENTSNNVYIYIGLGITLMLGIAIAIVGFGIYQTKHTGNVLGNKIMDLYYRLTKYYILNIFACDSIHVYFVTMFVTDSLLARIFHRAGGLSQRNTRQTDPNSYELPPVYEELQYDTMSHNQPASPIQEYEIPVPNQPAPRSPEL